MNEPKPASPAGSTAAGRRRSADQSLGRFAVRGVFWRQYLDWAALNLPFYFYPVHIFFLHSLLFLFRRARPPRHCRESRDRFAGLLARR